MMDFASGNSFGSRITTIPNTLIDDASPDSAARKDLEPAVLTDHNGDFARLIPKNLAARIAFSDVVENPISPHVVRYMHVRPIKGDMVGEMSASETETEPGPHLSLWSGYYRFNLDIMPFSYGLGYVVGRGRSDLENGGIEF